MVKICFFMVNIPDDPFLSNAVYTTQGQKGNLLKLHTKWVCRAAVAHWHFPVAIWKDELVN